MDARETGYDDLQDDFRQTTTKRRKPRNAGSSFVLATIKVEGNALHKARRGNDGKGACHTPRNTGFFAKMGY